MYTKKERNCKSKRDLGWAKNQFPGSQPSSKAHQAHSGPYSPVITVDRQQKKGEDAERRSITSFFIVLPLDARHVLHTGDGGQGVHSKAWETVALPSASRQSQAHTVNTECPGGR